ncbi:MAG: Gfo/Idh/MocA family oxidoreductase [Verrucomicrobia bacterium]|nr:Gfo/Idh/MocA family oxidoreductase [Verrucomicrobiota bacterium]
MPRLPGLLGIAAALTLQAALAAPTVKLITLDPGHFHAALVQAADYPQVDPSVHVYAPGGADLDQHLKRIDGYNTRADQPTHWQEEVHTGPDFFQRMLDEKKGSLVVISGNNSRKADYILRSVQAGYHVLSDKPMAITPADFEKLKQAFAEAEKRGVLLYDIMTERHETCTILQRELSRMPEIFGTLEMGTPGQPAITKESVHHYFKTVSGKPLQRPPWFFDVTQQGEGIVDVTTHLVDLVQWEAFPEQSLKPDDVSMLTARRWTTKVSAAQFEQATMLKEFPASLKANVNAAGELEVYANGEFTYTLRGVHAKVSVSWNFEAPPGAADTHYSIMRGSAANLLIRQGKEQNYKPTLYVENKSAATPADFEKALQAGLAKLQDVYPGLALKAADRAWEVVIPEPFKIGHEAHFAQVTAKFLKYLEVGKLPAWEVPNMLTKCHTIMEAYRLSR